MPQWVTRAHARLAAAAMPARWWCCLIGATVLLALCCQRSAQAQLPATRISACYPCGGQQGSELEVTIAAGTDLEGVDRLWFSHPGITAVQKTETVEGTEQPVANQFRVTIGADVPVGLYELRAVGTYGISNPRAFAVGDRTELTETEPNNQREHATEIAVGSWVNGRSDPAKDVDYFRFAAQAGQRVVIDVWAERLDSRMDATLELYDESGALLKLVRDFNHRDPLIDFVVPADGQYIIKLYDLQFRGGADYAYRLGVSTAPYIDFVFPPAGQTGNKQSFTLYGRNLPGGEPANVVLNGEPLEQLAIELALPDDPQELQRLNFDSLVEPPKAALDGVNYRLSSPAGSSNPVLITLATAPLVIEQEPNDETPQAVTPPCECVGRFDQPGDRDTYSFTGKKDEVYWIEVYSHRLGAPTDPLIVIEQVFTDENGGQQVKELVAQDDGAANIGGQSFNTASLDPVFRLVCPSDGEYRVRIRDLHSDTRGGQHMVYRLAIRPAQPDFRLVALPDVPVTGQQTPNLWTNFLRKGGTDMLRVLALRRDGFAGAIAVEVEGLPDGVRCRRATIGPHQNETTLVFEADEDAADWVGAIRLQGSARVGDTELVREVRPATVLIAAQNQRGISRLARDLTLAVGETAPYRVNSLASELRIPQSRWIEVPLQAVRRGEFAGDLSLTAVGIPANVQNETQTLAGADNETSLLLFAQADAPLGTYSFYVQSTTQVPFTKNADGSEKQPVAVIDASTPIEVTIVPGPLVLAPAPANNGAIQPGGKLEIPITITRRNEFAGPVELDLYEHSGTSAIQSSPVTVPEDQDSGTLVVEASAEAPEGNLTRIAVRARMQVDGETVEVHQPVSLVVQK